MKPMQQLEADFRSCVAGAILPKVGDAMPWAQGTLTRTGPKTLHYLNTVNGRFECDLTEHTDPKGLAIRCGAINWQWIQQYGINFRGTPAEFESNLKSLNHIAVHGVSEKAVFPCGIHDIPPLTAEHRPGGGAWFCIEGKRYTADEFFQTNIYKAITGANQ